MIEREYHEELRVTFDQPSSSNLALKDLLRSDSAILVKTISGSTVAGGGIPVVSGGVCGADEEPPPQPLAARKTTRIGMLTE